MTLPMMSRKSLALFLVGAAAIAPGAKLHAQSEPVRTETRSLVGGLLDQYAPGVRQSTGIDAALELADQAKTKSTLANPMKNAAVGDDAAAAARQRAQLFLNQYAPGMITLGETGVRVETESAVVDTRPDSPKVGVSQNSSMLHRLAFMEAEQAFRNGDVSRAERWIDAVAEERPEDPNVLQMQSLIRLQAGRIADSADSARNAMQAGKVWSMARLSNYFPKPAVYDSLFNAMRTDAENPSSDGKSMFLLAYHHLMLGQGAVAQQLLAQADRQLPPGYVTPAIRLQFKAK